MKGLVKLVLHNDDYSNPFFRASICASSHDFEAAFQFQIAQRLNV
jgi:hypothetical protein